MSTQIHQAPCPAGPLLAGARQLALLVFLGVCAFAGGYATVGFGGHLASPPAAQAQEGGPSAAVAGDPVRLSERFEAVARKLAPTVVAVEAPKPAQPAGPGSTRTRALVESASGVLVGV